MLPWGSQHRNQMSRESHAWVLAALDRDPQVQEAIASAERLQAQLDGSRQLELLAYSDGSVIGDGVEGSAAAILVIAGQDVTSVVRLAPADRTLSFGWARSWLAWCLCFTSLGACGLTSYCDSATSRWPILITTAWGCTKPVIMDIAPHGRTATNAMSSTSGTSCDGMTGTWRRWRGSLMMSVEG